MKYEIFADMERYVTLNPKVKLTCLVPEPTTKHDFAVSYDTQQYICKLLDGDEVLWQSEPSSSLEELEQLVTQQGWQLKEHKAQKQYWAYLNGKRLINLTSQSRIDKTTIPTLKRKLTKQYGNCVEFKYEV